MVRSSQNITDTIIRFMFSATDQNIPLAVLLLIIVITIVLACRKSYGKWLNPIAIISIWWGGWLAVAEINLIGIPAPSYYTSGIVVTTWIFCVFGALTGRKYQTFHPVNFSATKINKRIANYVGVCLLVIAGPIFWFSYLGLSIQSTLTDVASYRTELFGSDSVIYSSKFNYYMYIFVITPLLFVCVLWLQSRGFGKTKKEKWLAALVVLLVIAESLGTSGRLMVYFLVIGVVYCKIFRAHRLPNLTTSPSGAKAFIFPILLIILLLWMNQRRMSGNDLGVFDISAYFLVWYHTLGFSLLDLELNNSFSRLNDFPTLGQASFGGLIDYFLVPLHPIIQYDPVAYLNAVSQEEFQIVGYSDLLGAPIPANAYYTVFYSIFQDFGWFGIVGVWFLYGRLLNRSYRKYIHYGNFSSLYLLNALIFCGMFGLFQSPLESHRFWVAVIFAYFISKIESKRAGNINGSILQSNQSRR